VNRFAPFSYINLSAICFALSAVALGNAMQIANGFYDPLALTWLSWSLGLALAGALTQRWNEALVSRSGTIVSIILAAGIGWQLQQLYTAKPGFYVSGEASMPLFRSLIVAQGVLAAIGLLPVRVIRRLWFPAFLAVGAALGVWMLKASPQPQIDVVVVHKEALDALLSNRDPYRISFANVYEPWQVEIFYNREALIGNRLAFGYPYPPASLLLAVPGYVLFGDYRYSELGLLLAAAALIGYSRATVTAKLAACLLLTTPRVWFVIEQGWTEPIAIFTLALAAFVIPRNSIAAGAAMGLMGVTKQYLAFSGLAVLRFIFATRWRLVVFAVTAFVACAVTLPIALWHPNAFMRSVVWLQTLEPFRMDSLSYLSWAARSGLGRGTFIWAVGAAVIAAVVSLWTTRNTAAGFATSVAITTFMMFAFGSKAFCNYYFFVVGALCCAVGAFPSGSQRGDVRA